MKAQQDYEIDIRNNKVKQGLLVKRSRILKQWKQRWMVLTKTHLYSFVQKQVYKKPTQKIPLKQVSTIKSYYKNQYNRPQVIRIQSDDADFYLSAKNHQQKWAWMTAVEKMTDLAVCPQQEGTDTQNLIRETIRMSSAIRKTISVKSDKKQNTMGYGNEIPKDLFKKLNIIIQKKTVDQTVYPTLPEIKQHLSEHYQSTDSVNKSSSTHRKIFDQSKKQLQKTQQNSQIKSSQKVIEKIVQVQKIVYVPQIKQKIVYVPQIKQVIKTVYVNKNQVDSVGNSPTILSFLQSIMQLKCQNPKPLIEFIVFLIFSQQQKYTELILKFSTSQKVQHAFSNAFLQVMNQEIDQEKINSFLRFIVVLYENNYQYFYLNDLKLLIQILLRQLQMNRSYFNQYLIISVFNAMASKKWFPQIKHRRQQLISAMNDIKAWTNDPQSKFAMEQLLQKL